MHFSLYGLLLETVCRRNFGFMLRTAEGIVDVDLQEFSAINGLHLCEAAIHKQFRACDVAAVVGCEKHHGLRDLIGYTEPAERKTAGNGLHAFLGRFYGMPWGRVGKAWAHCVYANTAIF